jgi:hypothetical protein
MHNSCIRFLIGAEIAAVQISMDSRVRGLRTAAEVLVMFSAAIRVSLDSSESWLSTSEDRLVL